VLVHVDGKEDQVIAVGQNAGTGVLGNREASQLLNAAIIGAELLTVTQANHNAHKKSCNGTAVRGGHNTNFIVPLVICVAAAAMHIK
jgi:hypothetical protein